MAPIEARFVRLHPYTWHGHISLRMEFYGCSLKPGKKANTKILLKRFRFECHHADNI